jgi:hypothetical protein
MNFREKIIKVCVNFQSSQKWVPVPWERNSEEREPQQPFIIPVYLHSVGVSECHTHLLSKTTHNSHLIELRDSLMGMNIV